MYTVLLLVDSLRIAKGVVAEKHETANGHPLQQDEQKLTITQLTDKTQTHPIYQYNLEEGSFCSWKTVDIRLDT